MKRAGNLIDGSDFALFVDQISCQISCPLHRLWVVVGLLCVAPIVGAADYERFVKPPPLSTVERRLVQKVRRWGRHHGKPLRFDNRLARTAKWLVSRTPMSDELDLEAMRRIAWRWGWTDGQIAAVALRVPDGDPLAEPLERELTKDLRNADVNRIGLAVEETEGWRILLVLFSRRLINLLPMSERIEPGGVIALRGSMLRFVTAQALTLVAALPNGTIYRAPLEIRGRTFRGELRPGDIRGAAELQILLDRGGGPQIAATFPIGVGARPWPDKDPASWLPEVPGVAEEKTPEATLAALVLGIRASQGLSLPAQSSRLSQIAESHARDMRDNKFFAHRSPTTGDVTDRLRKHGVHYARALENIALAPTVRTATESWMASPSHRQNLLDPDVTAFGIGVAPERGGSGQLNAVLVLARLADDGAAHELVAKAQRSIDARRLELGRRRLIADPALSRLAARHSREMAGAGRLGDVSNVRGPLVDTVFRDCDVSEAAADVYLANSVAVVARSPHIARAFGRVGIGVYREADSKGPQLWVTVIYASD